MNLKQKNIGLLHLSLVPLLRFQMLFALWRLMTCTIFSHISSFPSSQLPFFVFFFSVSWIISLVVCLMLLFLGITFLLQVTPKLTLTLLCRGFPADIELILSTHSCYDSFCFSPQRTFDIWSFSTVGRILSLQISLPDFIHTHCMILQQLKNEPSYHLIHCVYLIHNIFRIFITILLPHN